MPDDKRACCKNCNLETPKVFMQCVHCGKPWNVAQPPQAFKKPTEADIIAYNIWLQKTITQ